MDLSDLDCPQYVCFLGNRESFEGSQNSLSHHIIHNTCSKIDVKDETTACHDVQDQSIPSNLYSSVSESYLSSESYQNSPQNFSLKPNSEDENFPVMRTKQLFPHKIDRKASKTNRKTKIKPFNLHSGKKRKRENEYISLAEQVAAFQRKTPARFHTNGSKCFEPTEHWSPTVVSPKSPNLQAAKRLRGVNVLSREEQEEKEAEEMRKYKFRARPVNHNILHQPQNFEIGKKSITKPKSLRLRTAQRAAEIYNRSKDEEKPHEFHARPVPKAILSGPTGLKEKPIMPLTAPKTPNFALKRRAEKWNENKRESVDEVQTFRAAPLPPSSAPFVPKYENKHTEIQPFSFDVRDKGMKKRDKIDEMEKENEVYVFKARLMPDTTPSALPIVPKKPPTQPEPFDLHINVKSTRNSSIMDQQCPTFKAQPATILKKPPFVPEKSEKTAVEIQEFNLHTEIRASERLKLKEINAIKEQEKERELQRMKRIKEDEERLEIAKLRKEAVHKANPIRQYKQIEIKHSNKPVTVPISPKFRTNQRQQNHIHE